MDAEVRTVVRKGTGGLKSARVAAGFVSLGLILLVAGIQFGREVLMSLKDYNIFEGIIGSPWVGLDNYRVFFERPGGAKVIINTVLFNLLFAGFCFVVSFIAGAVISCLSKRSIVRDALAVLALLPVFIPGEVYTTWFFDLLGTFPFINAGSVFFLLPFLVSLKYAGIPIMMTHVLGILKKEKDRLLPVKCAGLFSVTAMSLAGTGYFSSMYLFMNPLILESSDILDTFSFRTGFQSMQISIQAAAGVLQVLVCLVSLALLFIPIKILFKSTFSGEKEYMKNSAFEAIPGSVLALAAFVFLYLLPYILNGKLSGFLRLQWMAAGNWDTLGSLPERTAFIIPPSVTIQWIIVSLAAALLCTGIAFAAGGFSDGGKTARICGVTLLVVITLLTVQPFTFSGYMSLRSFGMINTYAAVMLASMFSAAAVWAYAAMRGDRHITGTRGLLFGILGIFLIQTALIYSNGTSALIYLSRPDMSPLLMYKQLLTITHSVPDFASRPALAGSLGISGIMLSFPPILIFLLAKVILPAESMLAVIAAGRKQ